MITHRASAMGRHLVIVMMGEHWVARMETAGLPRWLHRDIRKADYRIAAVDHLGHTVVKSAVTACVNNYTIPSRAIRF